MDGKRIVYFGMGGAYSLIPLEALVQAGAQVAAVVFPRPMADDKGPRWMPAAALPTSDPELVIKRVSENILTKAGDYGIPVLEVGSMRNKMTLEAIEELEPDLVVVACFSQILPEKMLELPSLGCLNIHPSLLPAYRGPDPLFWQFRAGEQDTGVSVHWMDVGVDTGDILGQTRVEFSGGITAVEADKLVAQAGANLILEALREDEWPRHPQVRKGASYQANPGMEDRAIPVSWGVQRAFNFLRGANGWAPFWIEMADDERVEVRETLGYVAGSRIGGNVETQDGETWVQMGDGVLRVV